MKQVANISEYQAIVEKYGQKGVRSNDFIQKYASDLIACDKFFVDCYEKNAFFFCEEGCGNALVLLHKRSGRDGRL